MKSILLSFLIQIVSTIGVIYLGGFIISLLCKTFYKIIDNAGPIVCYATGIIGTPIHEVSHLAFCLIFRHKVNEIKLFQIDSETGVLGYVDHSYNTKSIYQKAGNFFIGVAPIVVMSAILYAFSIFLINDLMETIFQQVQAFDIQDVKSSFADFKIIFEELGHYFTKWQFWVFIAIGIVFSLHMNLSNADIKNSFSGLLIVIIFIFAIDLVVGLINVGYLNIVNRGCLRFSSIIVSFLSMSIIISIGLIIVALLIKSLIRVLSRGRL